MGRPRRFHVDGAFWHVFHRGNNKQRIYFDDADRRRYLRLVEEGLARFGHRIHAFCLMGNHAHMLVQVGTVPLGVVMHNLSSRYAKSISRRFDRVGHLFQGRYGSIPVETDRQLLALMRYVRENPSDAGFVADPLSYPWSSVRDYFGNRDYPWVETAFVLEMLGGTPEEQAAGLRDLCTGERQGAEETEKILKRWEAQAQEEFGEPTVPPGKPAGHRGVPESLVASVAAEFGVSAGTLLSRDRRIEVVRARDALLARAAAGGTATLAELARWFGVSPSTVTRAMQRAPVDERNGCKSVPGTVQTFNDIPSARWPPG